MTKNFTPIMVAVFLSLPFHFAVAEDKMPDTSTPVATLKGGELATNAEISLEEARAIALKSASGEITDEELEAEQGGSGLRYSFDIRQGGITREVGVDAKTGKILENAEEGPNPD